jgi:hypothetical protein
VFVLIDSFLEVTQMKAFFLSICLTVVAAASVAAQNTAQNLALPELHEIRTVTLSPSYSCRSSEDFQRGYASTALFLSPYAKQRNTPDLLFNGACKAEDYFEASGFSLIADLGAQVSLEEISTSRAFNLRRVHTDGDYSKFMRTVKVMTNHTYAVLINDDDRRGLYIFKVDDYAPNQKVVLRYAVKLYQVTPVGGIQSAGFDWEKGNH